MMTKQQQIREQLKVGFFISFFVYITLSTVFVYKLAVRVYALEKVVAEQHTLLMEQQGAINSEWDTIEKLIQFLTQTPKKSI